MKGFTITRFNNRRVLWPVQLILPFRVCSENMKVQNILLHISLDRDSLLYCQTSSNHSLHVCVLFPLFTGISWQNTTWNSYKMTQKSVGKCRGAFFVPLKNLDKPRVQLRREKESVFSSALLLNFAVSFCCRILIILCLFKQTHF